ncbi:hypothetical protein EYS14_05485 [Alteromonadaceae bacterium M269]|nr:hypothetical protein EYS14_05485 [Alteromonadaceae bacterium M269]
MRNLVLSLLFLGCFSNLSVQANESHDVFIPSSNQSFSHVFRHNIDSKALKSERVIDVALPASYTETGADIKYPVIIVLDGELLFHSVSGIVQLQAMNSQMPEAIVVSIPNEPDARRDITPKPLNKKGEPLWFGGQQDKYLSFIKDELFPFLKAQYRVADFNILIGLSPTANFALHSFWKQPDLFSAYIAINGANFKADGYGDQDVFQKILASVEENKANKRYLYISMTQGGVTRNPHILDTYRKLEKELTPFGENRVSFKSDIIDKTSYAATLPAIMSGLEFVFPSDDWDPSYRDFVVAKPNQTLTNIKNYFDELSAKYGFPALPKGERYYNRNRLKRIAYVFIQERRYDEAEAIITYWQSFYPKSANAQDTMADLYAAKGELAKATAYREKAVEFAKANADKREGIFEEALQR